MDLTSEEKLRIEEEERRRIAEEQYRAEVRTRLQQPAGASQPPLQPSVSSPPPSQPSPKKSRSSFRTIALAVLAGAFVMAFIANINKGDGDPAGSASSVRASSLPTIRYVPVSQKIATGQIVVKSSGYVQYRIRIDPQMKDARVTGSFNASGGSGNDISAVIAREDEFTNWINGHQARVFYGTNGKKTTDSFDVRLAPGSYVLGFSNKFSAFSDKYIFLEVDLNYSRPQTF